MGAPTYTIPTNNGDTSTEEPKITTALSDLKTLLTGRLGDANIATGGVSYSKLDLTNLIRNADIKSNAAIAHTKLEDIPDGHVLAGVGGTNTTRGFRALLTALGVLGDVNGLDVNMVTNDSTYTALSTSFTPDAGMHLIAAFTRFEASAAMTTTTLRIRTSTSVTLGTDYTQLTSGGMGANSAVALALYDAPGGVSVLADAKCGALSGTVVCRATHGIVGLPVADIDNL